MTTIKYALEKGGPKRLEISWTGVWKDVSVRLDGNEIGTFTDAEQMKEGREFTLPDGSILKIRLDKVAFCPMINIFLNGKPLPGMPEPSKRLSYAYQVTFLIGVVNLLGGLMNTVFQSRLIGLAVPGLYLVIAGCIFFILGFFIMKKSKIALTIAVGIVFIDLISLIFFRSNINFILVIVMIIFRLIILFLLVQAFGAITILKQKPVNQVEQAANDLR